MRKTSLVPVSLMRFDADERSRGRVLTKWFSKLPWQINKTNKPVAYKYCNIETIDLRGSYMHTAVSYYWVITNTITTKTGPDVSWYAKVVLWLTEKFHGLELSLASFANAVTQRRSCFIPRDILLQSDIRNMSDIKLFFFSRLCCSTG